MKKDLDEVVALIHAYLDGFASQEEVARLNNSLRIDPAARDLYLQLADTHSCLAVDERLWIQNNSPSRVPGAQQPPVRQRWLARHPLAAAVAGVVLGMCCTSFLFAYVAPSQGRTKIVISESIEAGAIKTAPGLPRETDRRAGDEAAAVSSSPELKTHSGGKMLRFLSATYPGENSPRSLWGDVYRLVDVQGLAASGHSFARLSANFAQEKESPAARFSCSVEAFALDQELSALPEVPKLAWLQQNNSASVSRRLVLSALREWQDVSVEVPITSQTRLVLLHLAVQQTSPAIEAGVIHFPGQYVDDVKLEVVSRP